MIIWINGAFGSGKSTVAEELNKKIINSFIYDPEQVGYFLWDNFPNELKEKGNFQHIPIWREFNYKILKHISDNYDGTIIVPMTIYQKEYFDEIIGNLTNDRILVKHFILSAPKQTIINRLYHRGEPKNCWAVQHIDKCLETFETDITEIKINTYKIGITEIVKEIIRVCNSVL